MGPHLRRPAPPILGAARLKSPPERRPFVPLSGRTLGPQAEPVINAGQPSVPLSRTLGQPPHERSPSANQDGSQLDNLIVPRLQRCRIGSTPQHAIALLQHASIPREGEE